MRYPNLVSTAAFALCIAPLGSALAASGHGGGAAPAAGSSAVRASATVPARQTGTMMRGPSHTGQPNQTCGSASAPETPGAAASAPGSAFNPDGKAGTVYAGQQPQNSRNTASVSQYDVACSHQK